MSQNQPDARKVAFDLGQVELTVPEDHDEEMTREVLEDYVRDSSEELAQGAAMLETDPNRS